MEFTLAILTVAVILGGYALKRLNDSVKSYSKSFGDESGRIDATTQKLNDIQSQLAQSVEITESIKKDIEQGAWRERELELLKRVKLETYLMCYYTAINNLTHKMNETFFGAKINYDREVDAKLSMLRILYLPELDEEHVEFLILHAEFMIWLVTGQRMMLEQERAGTLVPQVSSEHMKNHPILIQRLNECTSKVERKTKSIGRTINSA